MNKPQPPTAESEEHKVLRGAIREHRGDYFVEYHCAQPPYCAMLNVIFSQRAGERTFVQASMERELKTWLKRYPVPLMIHGIDETERTINFSSTFGESTLMGYVTPGSRSIVHRWGLFKDVELPAEQLTQEYLAKVYADVPFELASEVKQKADRKLRSQLRAANTIIFFLVVVPVLIEVIALGVDWLGHIMAAISIAAGCYKVGRAFGWIRQSKRDEEKAAEELRMRHHHYHCERNPEAFAKLRSENFDREARDRVLAEAKELRS